MSVTLRCLKCAGEDLVRPKRLHRKSILTCRTCNAIAPYGDLLEAAGRRLLIDLQQQLANQRAG